MNKLEYLTRLRNSLEKGGLAADDINDALSYYDEVFLDAGFGKDAETAASLGSPEEVATNILRESGIHVGGAPVMPPQRVDAQDNYSQNGFTQGNAGAYAPPPQTKKKASGGAIAAGIILGIVLFPIWLPLLIVVVALLFTAIVAVVSLIFAAVVTGAALIVGGFVLLFSVPSIALMFIGGGLFLTGLVVLICKPVFGAVIPACGRAISRFCSWIIGLFKKGGKTNE